MPLTESSEVCLNIFQLTPEDPVKGETGCGFFNVFVYRVLNISYRRENLYKYIIYFIYLILYFCVKQKKKQKRKNNDKVLIVLYLLSSMFFLIVD